MSEEKSNKRPIWVYLLVGVGVVAFVCIGSLFVLGVGAYIFREDIVAAGLRTTTPNVTPYGDLPAALPDGEMPPNGDLEEQFASIEQIITDVRGLELLESVPRAFLSRAELATDVEEDLLAEYTPEDARDDAYVLYALDVVPRDYDLLGLYQDFYSVGVAGFYDPEAQEFFIVGEDDILDAEEEITYAHELVHVLQDQHHDLNEFMRYDDEDFFLSEADSAFARQAVVEGDATITERLYEQNYMLPDRVDEYYLAQLEYDLSFFATVPDYIIAGLIFPYIEGAIFVQAVYERGGFPLVDSLYTDPPVSTEHILHPETYFAGEQPIPVTVEDALTVLPEGYRLIYTSQMGEFGLRSYLDQNVSTADATTAATGWGGDAYAAYVDDASGDVVLTMLTEWDSAAEADEFLTTFTDYQSAWHTPEDEFTTCAQQGSEALCIYPLTDTRVLIVRAPEALTTDLRALYD